MNPSTPSNDIAHWVWQTKYQRVDHSGQTDRSIDDSWRRVAKALAATERHKRRFWNEAFFALMRDLLFLPGGRIIAGAGTNDEVTLFNCFVMAPLDDREAVLRQSFAEIAVTMCEGGGVGFDASLLAPHGTVGSAPGPLARLHALNALCDDLRASNARRGAMMATLRCDHPDIGQFIDAKRDAGALRNFNLSVQVTDDFIAAVRADLPWPLVFPEGGTEQAWSGAALMRQWTGSHGPVPCRVHAETSARQLWKNLLRATYDSAEPGILFVDRINHLNNLSYREHITATNPCGEVPLPSYGVCVLGSLNLPRFVHRPFAPDARLDRNALRAATRLAVRFLDNAIDIARYPLPQQEAVARQSRRVGLGITGLADTLLMLGLRYSSPEARIWAAREMQLICETAYRASIELAREKGAFPTFERSRYLGGRFVKRLPPDIRRGISEHGIRNSHLIAIAPTGSISLLAGCVSSSLEPIFAASYERTLTDRQGAIRTMPIVDPAVALWRTIASDQAGLPSVFECAADIAPEEQLDMQAALQPHVDNAISKTVAVAADLPFEAFERIFDRAYDLGLKGCTAFRPDTLRGAVLTSGDAACQTVPS